jgi:RNA polymerase sigma-70 factor, ECF subfamily
MPAGEEVTKLLVEWNNGNAAAKDLLVPMLYDELRRLAESYLRREGSAATLQATALVHEAYLRLVGNNLPDWQSRAHFFGVAANLMRQILVDHARRQKSAKRGGGALRVSLDEALDFAPEKSSEIIALDDALHSLAAVDERKCRIIELRFFGGFTLEETAQTLGVSIATVGKEQRLAEAWLHREVRRGATP